MRHYQSPLPARAKAREQEEALNLRSKMKSLRPFVVSVFAGVLLTSVCFYWALAVSAQIALLLPAEDLYSESVVTVQKERAAHSNNALTRFQYVCPMHEDVKSTKPGKCPKCKMKLEKKQIKEPTASPGQ